MINYRSQGDIIEIIIRDFSGQKIETHKCSVHEKKKYKSILKYLKDKYGFSPEITPEELINADPNKINWWE